jgi:thiol-disulfide isomerase/thioredoxin
MVVRRPVTRAAAQPKSEERDAASSRLDPSPDRAVRSDADRRSQPPRQRTRLFAPGSAKPRWIKPTAIVVALGLVGLIAFAVVSAMSVSPGSLSNVTSPSSHGVDAKAPTFDLASLNGHGRVRLAGSPGTPQIVNFFASWCSNCIAELHAFGAVSNASTGVRFLGVDVLDPSAALARKLLKDADVRYEIGVDPNGLLAGRYGIAALPVTFFVARTGVVVGELFGQATASELDAWVAKLGGKVGG